MTMLLIVNLVVDLFLLLVFEMHLLEHPPFEDADQGEADYDKEHEENGRVQDSSLSEIGNAVSNCIERHRVKIHVCCAGIIELRVVEIRDGQKDCEYDQSQSYQYARCQVIVVRDFPFGNTVLVKNNQTNEDHHRKFETKCKPEPSISTGQCTD